MAQFNVNLAFNADTGKAKTQIQELQSLLNKIAYSGTTSSTTGGLQKDLHSASEAAKELQFHLNNAFNTSTGNFDLSMLDKSLKTSGSNITDLSTKLLSAGATGQQAFVKLAQSISLADQPMLRIGKRMQDFAVTMKNTVKWQLSSSMLHGFMGAIQSAYGYAQDLNKSLNDIRIVTGYNTDRMAEFAEQANKAAKALSTTTTDYTNASLIYFQQGLSDEEVTARTDITVKMANAVGQSAEVISEQLTAVWNNFDDGNKSLEYYADVMTALGAATASSSDEISEGLSKFAAVAGSVGLSYEYATSALATLTSNTRESADVVGNSLKTLFARIQGLTLGETLDDGTDLNKYSQALEKVGISIYDANGGLKDMDNILDEMAAKWTTLSDTQQVALAQTVAGVRQYNQLIALMENWNNGDSDSMIANLNTVAGSEGALQKQADIYAESWEAAEKRVQAAAEGIYQSLLDDDFFISLTNGFANALNGIDAFIDGAGGVKTVLAGIAGIIISTFANKIPQALDTFKYNLQFLTKGTQAAYDDIQQQMEKASKQIFEGFTTVNGEKIKPVNQDSSLGYQITAANELTAARNRLAVISDKMSAAELQMANSQLSIIENVQQEIIALKQKNETLAESIKLEQDSLRQSQGSKINTSFSKDLETIDTAYNDARKRYNSLYLEFSDQFNQLYSKDNVTEKEFEKLSMFEDLKNQYSALIEENDSFNGHYQQMISDVKNSTQHLGQNILEGFLNPAKAKEQVLDFKNSTYDAIQSIQSLMSRTDIDEQLTFDTAIQEIKALQGAIPKVIQETTGLNRVFIQIKNSANLKELQQNFKLLEPALRKCKIEIKDFPKFLRAIHGKEIDDLSKKMKQLNDNTHKAVEKAKTLQKLFNEFNPSHTIRMSEALGSLTGMMHNVVTIGNSVKSMFNAVTNPDLSGWERFSAVLTGLTMIIPSTLSMLNALGTTLTWIRTVETAGTVAIHQKVIARNADIIATGLSEKMSKKMVAILGEEHIKTVANIIAQEKEAGSSGKVAAAKAAEYLASTGLVSAKTAEQLSHLAVKLGVDLETASIWQLIGALLTMQVTILGITAPIWAIVAAFVALAAIIGAVGVAAYNAYHADEKAAENARKAVEDLTESYKRLTDEANTFKDAVSSYEDAVASLKDLEKGTDEYREALEKANEQARQLIETYGLWGQTHYDENGVITFDEDVLEGKQTEYDTRVREAESQLYSAKIASNEANIRFKITDLKRELGNIVTEIVQTSVSNTTPYAAGTSAYSATSSYAASQQQQQTYNRQLTNDEVQQIAKALELAEQKVIAGEYDSLEAALGSIDEWNNLSGAVRGSIDAIIANKDAFTQLTNTMNNADSANKYYAGEIIRNTIEEQSGAELREIATGSDRKVDEGLYNQLVNAVTEREKAKQEQYENGLADQIARANRYQDVTSTRDLQNFEYGDFSDVKTDEDLAYRYAKDILDYTDEELATFDYKKGNGVGTLVDASGNTIMSEVNDEYMRQQLARQAEIDAITQKYEQDYADGISEDSAQAYIDSLGTMVESSSALGNKYGVDFTNSLLSAIANGTSTFDFSSLYSELSPAEHAELIAMTPDELVQTLGLTPEMLQQMGLKSAEEFEVAFDKGLKGWTPEDFTESVNAKYEKKAEDYGIDVDEFKVYRDLLLQTNSALAEQPELLNKIALRQKRLQKGVKSLSDNWEDFNEAISSGDIVKISEILPDVNDALKDMLNLTDEEFEGLSPDFAVKNWELIQDYMNGVEGSYERIQTAAAAEIIFGASYDLDGLQNSEQAIIDEMLSFQAEHGDLEIGATINTSEALSGLWDLYDSGKMTVGQLQEAFNSLGWEPEIEYVPVDAETAAAMRSAGYQEYAVMNADGSMSIHSVPLDGELVQSSDQQYYLPKIKSKNATNTGGNRPPSPPSRTDKNKGSGGGSKTKKETKQRDDEVERYHVVKEQMEELEKQAEKLSKAKDQAFGKGKLDLIEKEIELLDEQIKKQDEYLKQIQKYGEEDKALMIVYGAQFDENGVITNYEQLMDQELAKYNKAVEQYNKNHDEKKFAAAEARYEKFLNDMEQYEETMDEWDEAQAARADMLREIYDLKFEALTYEIEVDIDLEEDDLKLLDYYLEKLDDDAFSAAESVTLLGKKTQDLLDQSKIYSDGIMDLLSLHGLSDERINQYMNGSLTEQELITMGFSDEDIATLREYRDNLLEINKDLSSIREEIYSKIVEAFDAWNEKITDNIDKIEKLNKVLNSYQNIIDIVGTNTLKIDDKFMKNLSNAIVDNSKKVLDASVKKYHSLQEAQLQAQQEYEKSLIEGNEETIRYWEETLEHINNEVQNAEQEMMDSWQDALQAAADAFDKSVENIMDNFEKALSGSFGNLDNLSEIFEQRTEIADRYLDDYEKIYQLSKLNRDINNSIDDTDSIKAKKILKSLQEDINELQNSEQEMSQYDLEYLQKRYELKLAEIALEEAQNAKSTVRMMQDSEGNWSYVYTSDQEEISNAQQQYEDALFNMQVANEDYIQDLQEKALDAQKAMTEAIKSIDKTQFATEDAYKERIDQIREYYMDQQNYYYDEMAKALSNNKELYENDWLNYSNLTNYKISSDKEYVDNFAETTYAQIMGYNSIEEAQNNFIMATDVMVEEIIESYTLWLNNINEIMDLAGTSIDTFASDTENNLNRINEKTNEVADSIDDLSQDIVDDFNYIIDVVSDWEDNYVDAIDTTIEANEDMYDSCNNLIGMLNNVDISISNTGKNFSSTAQQIAKAAADIAAAAQRAAAAAQNIASSGGSISSGSTSTSSTSQQNKSITITLYSTKYLQGKMGIMKVTSNTPISVSNQLQAGGASYYASGPGWQGYISTEDRLKLRQTFPERFDTGGYTGAWGTSGKLAVLHEKELVLNAEDTQNMLNAINIVREITKAIDLNAGIQSLGLQLQNLSNLASGINNSDIQQIVQITAEFPDAVYHSEIEEAFKTLLNESSQYISREK